MSNTILQHLPKGQKVGIAFWWLRHQCSFTLDAPKGAMPAPRQISANPMKTTTTRFPKAMEYGAEKCPFNRLSYPIGT